MDIFSPIFYYWTQGVEIMKVGQKMLRLSRTGSAAGSGGQWYHSWCGRRTGC